jgi:hypothetical protein
LRASGYAREPNRLEPDFRLRTAWINLAKRRARLKIPSPAVFGERADALSGFLKLFGREFDKPHSLTILAVRRDDCSNSQIQFRRRSTRRPDLARQRGRGRSTGCRISKALEDQTRSAERFLGLRLSNPDCRDAPLAQATGKVGEIPVRRGDDDSPVSIRKRKFHRLDSQQQIGGVLARTRMDKMIARGLVPS